jgi:acyl-CoA thioesterase FadM
MIDLKLTDFMNRVLTTRERVKFPQADPYGHLNSGEYVSLVMGHRVEALQDQLRCDVGQWARILKIGYVLRELQVEFVAPAFVGAFLEVASWGYLVEPDGLRARFVIVDEGDRAARAFGAMRFVTVNLATGRKVPGPDALPSTADTNLLLARPTTAEYLQTIRNVPEAWRA